jgi:hypothetical protein
MAVDPSYGARRSSAKPGRPGKTRGTSPLWAPEKSSASGTHRSFGNGEVVRATFELPRLQNDSLSVNAA